MSDGPKDFEKHIKTQLLRLSHLLGYPTEPVALRDYIAALSVAQTYEGAQRVMDAIVQELVTRECPTAAMIRAKAYDDREKQQQRPVFEAPRAAHCPDCQDTGIAESNSAADFTSIARYCDCTTGQERKRATGHRSYPDLVNEARAKLRKLFKTDPLPQLAAKSKLLRTPDSVYHGEF